MSELDDLRRAVRDTPLVPVPPLANVAARAGQIRAARARARARLRLLGAVCAVGVVGMGGLARRAGDAYVVGDPSPSHEQSPPVSAGLDPHPPATAGDPSPPTVSTPPCPAAPIAWHESDHQAPGAGRAGAATEGSPMTYHRTIARNAVAVTGLALGTLAAGCNAGPPVSGIDPGGSIQTTTTVPPTADPTGPTSPTSPTMASTPTTRSGGAVVPSTPVTAPPSTAPSPPAVTGCRAAGLRIEWFHTNNAAGSSLYNILFTNTGAVTCTMQGSTGVSFLDAAGNQLGPPANTGSSGPHLVVTLAPGGQAHASVAVQHAQYYEPATCGPMLSTATIRVFAPDDTADLRAPAQITVCSNIPIVGVNDVASGPGEAPNA